MYYTINKNQWSEYPCTYTTNLWGDAKGSECKTTRLRELSMNDQRNNFLNWMVQFGAMKIFSCSRIIS